MQIVNPSYGVSAAGGEALKGAQLDWMKDPIAPVLQLKAKCQRAHGWLEVQTRRHSIRGQYRLPLQTEREPAGTGGDDGRSGPQVPRGVTCARRLRLLFVVEFP